ncbi:hypothetical protein [Moraxella lacunata]|uniref:hypothetical protein n=1 Tax=Moraxella lacunata TaxID=477 RepID=UPI003EE0B22C
MAMASWRAVVSIITGFMAVFPKNINDYCKIKLANCLEHVEHSQQSHPLTNKSQSYCTFITHQ